MSDEDWLVYQKFVEGDVQSFRRLFEKFKNPLFRLCHRFVRNHEAAEDIAQDVLIKIYEKRAKFDPRSKFSTWVYRVAANASLDYLRRKKFSAFSLDAPEAPDAEDPASLSHDLQKRELEALVGREVQNLPERLKAPIILFQFEEKSYQEIAAILQISVKAVERRIYHAKEMLRRGLADALKD